MTSLFRNLNFIKALYLASNLGLILIAYLRIEETVPFLFVAFGIAGMGYFIQRALRQLIGN